MWNIEVILKEVEVRVNAIFISFVLTSLCNTSLANSQSEFIKSDNNGIITAETTKKIKSLIEKGGIPSLQVVVVADNKIIYSIGCCNEAGEVLLYKIGSIEKVLTATALMQMHEKGIINIDNDINKYLPFSVRHPDFPDTPITVKMLLAQRSGLEMFQYQVEWDTKDLQYFKDSTEVYPEVTRLSKVEFMKESLDTAGVNFNPDIWKFRPGTNYIYSNSGYFILSYLVECVSGISYSNYVTKNIFDPLEMSHSVFSDLDSAANFSDAYTRRGELNIKVPFIDGMYTNAEDMANVMIAYLNNGKFNNISLLKPGTIEFMHKKHSHRKDLFHLSSNCPFTGYGLGIIQYGKHLFGHGGSTIGYQSLFTFNKKSKKGYIILTNVNGLIYGEANFKSVWATVSSVERLIKSELGFPTHRLKGFSITVIVFIGIIISFLYFRRRAGK